MTSIIAWLDTSAEEQRKIRDLLAQFTQPESRDELGIGQIRDAFSDALFPGTSVIQTRARYFLFVPWIFRDGARKQAGARLKAWTDVRERRLIEALRRAGETEGLIGRRAGPAVKILPSSIYWSGLVRYGILTRDVAPDQLDRTPTARPADGADELAARVRGDWVPTLPEAPPGFPETVDGGFALPHHEASWLREQMIRAAPDTLLAHLLGHSDPPNPDSEAPWEDSACWAAAPAAARSLLRHAELFSLAIHGAALLYNLLVGERYRDKGYTSVEESVERYRELLDDWSKECADRADALSTWDRAEFWSRVMRDNPRVSWVTRTFVDTWLDAVCDGQAATVADDQELRDLVTQRERQQKQAQSRLRNERLLRTWSGASGSARLAYRWPQVRRLLTDIHDGLGRDAGA